MTGLIVVILTIRYAPVHYKYYQLQRRDFWYCMSAFNLGYGMFGSLLMIRSIRSEETDTVRRRKKLRMEVLIPLITGGCAQSLSYIPLILQNI